MIVGTQYRCCGDNQNRRDAIAASVNINGIDYLEVIDDATLADSPRQRTLLVHLFKPPATPLTAENLQIDGGVRITGVAVTWAFPFSTIPPGTLQPDETAYIAALPDTDRIVVVRTDKTGDFSEYVLSLRASQQADAGPPPDFDVKLSSIDFSFKVDCPSLFDCAPKNLCPPEVADEPEIDYLSKDFSSFKRLMLDRLSVTMPKWRERNPADVGVVLIELLAYAADHLSYYQDAVATEAYLGTARRRVSVRRHARLLDYAMHDGANARAWVAIEWKGPAGTLLARNQVQFLTRAPETEAPDTQYFEPLEDVTLDPGLSQIAFYTWGEDTCCLPKGATRATLDNTGNRLANLRQHDALLFVEVISPEDVLPEDADPTHRHVVRLSQPPVFKTDPLFQKQVVEIEWSLDDALPFALCLSRVAPKPIAAHSVAIDKPAFFPVIIRVDAVDGAGAITQLHWWNSGWSSNGSPNDSGKIYLKASFTGNQLTDPASTITATFLGTFGPGDTFAFGPASVALGNVVLVDHGRSTTDSLPPVLEGSVYRPQLRLGPVAQQGHVADEKGELVTFDRTASAASALVWKIADVLPAVVVTTPQLPDPWAPERDLLESGQFTQGFVVETEDDGTATLRFGDGTLGRVPDVTSPTDAPPSVTYRVGNGTIGNVGADAIAHPKFSIGGLATLVGMVRNPLPARGGLDPETSDEVRAYAPQAFRVQQDRAVTEEDYATIAMRHPEVQRAVATRRWTGSWYTMFLSVDRRGGLPIDGDFESELRAFLEQYRLAAQDLEIEAPQLVPLAIDLKVCIDSRYFRADVIEALEDALSSRVLPDGRRGFFHPDNFTFGQAVYLSQVVAAAMQVPGVKWVDPSPGSSKFRRFFDDNDDSELLAGVIAMSRLEVARLDNDPNFPEHGTLNFSNPTGGL